MRVYHQKKRFEIFVMLFLCFCCFGSYAQTITTITSTKVTSNYEGDVNTNIGSCPYVYLDTWSNEQENIFIEFDLSDLNSNTIINSAVLRFVQGNETGGNAGGGGDITFDVFRVTEAWEEGTGGCFVDNSPGLTWANATGTVIWGTAGGDYDGATSYGNATGSFNSGNDAFKVFEIDITALAQQWLDVPTLNHGLVLVPRGGQAAAWFNIFSDDTATPSNRPSLIVTQPCGLSAVVDVVRPLCTTSTGQINITNPGGATNHEYRLGTGAWQTNPNLQV